MATCSQCGNPIEFRYVDGRCTPLHLHGDCTGTGSGTVVSNPRYSKSEESCCSLTACPKCNEPVFFVRHNGGGVWIDPPLGPPWYKHPCMDDTPALVANGKRSLAPPTPNHEERTYPKDAILGVVKEVEVSFSRLSSVIAIETDKDAIFALLMKHNAGFLTGKLVLYRPQEKTVVIFEEESYGFSVVASMPGAKTGEPLSPRIVCPECGSPVSLKNLKKHLRGQHSYL